MDRGAWRAPVQGVPKCGTQLSDYTFTFSLFNKAVMDFPGLQSIIHLTRLKAEPQKAVFPP